MRSVELSAFQGYYLDMHLTSLVTYFEASVTNTQSYTEDENKTVHWKECRNIAQMCRGGSMTARVHLKLKLARNLKSNRKG